MPIDDIKQTRLEKLEKIKRTAIDPYPAKSWRTHEIAEAMTNFDKHAEAKDRLVLVGRIMARREHGGSMFLDIEDGSGRMQAYFKKDVLGDKEYNFFNETVDIGDFVEIYGFLFKTKKEEKTLEVEKYRLLSKSLLPLPEKWHGLTDIEERYRKRYLDLLFNPEIRAKFKLRGKLIDELRNFMNQHNFLEVETPTLQVLAGGAMAKPFKTHLNALDLDVYLRIAPELFLKRLLVGGFEKVYEFSHNFRNEGMDRDHNPEFSELEFYIAYKDYEWLMEFTEKMFEQVVSKLFETTKVRYSGETVDFHGPYRRVTFNDLLREYSGIDYDVADEDTLKAKAKELEIKIEKVMTKGTIADEIYKKVARPKIIQPTFIINHPLEISPLAKTLEGEPEHVARVQLIVAGHEIINAYSELNDPVDQRARFEAQQKAAKKGAEETHPFDEDFVEALEYGMPPAAGWGLGIDRLVAILTDSHSIREVILFPLMKPR